jgi:hypothetical protein
MTGPAVARFAVLPTFDRKAAEPAEERVARWNSGQGQPGR